jgi:hypothetical protein
VSCDKHRVFTFIYITFGLEMVKSKSDKAVAPVHKFHNAVDWVHSITCLSPESVLQPTRDAAFLSITKSTLSKAKIGHMTQLA